MKKNLIFVAIGIALIGSSAYAGNAKDCPPGDPGSTVTGTQTQGQGQTQNQGQSQSGTVTGSNRNANNSTATGGVSGAVSGSASTSGAQAATGAVSNSVTTGQTTASGGTGGDSAANQQQSQGNGNSQTSSTTYTEPRSPVMTAFAMASNTTAECRYGDALGVQTFGLGLSASKSRADKDCRLKVMADVEYARGNGIAGDKLTCLISYVHEALGADCEALLQEQTKRQVRYSEPEVHGLLDKQAAVLKAGK